MRGSSSSAAGSPSRAKMIHDRSSDVKGFATAAAALLVGVREHESRLQLLLGINPFSVPIRKQRRLGVDSGVLTPFVSTTLVHRLRCIGEFERVRKTRAALGSARRCGMAGGWLAAALDQRLHPLGGGRRHLHQPAAVGRPGALGAGGGRGRRRRLLGGLRGSCLIRFSLRSLLGGFLGFVLLDRLGRDSRRSPP